MSISQAGDVERVAITTTRQPGGNVTENALHLRAASFARILAGSRIFNGDSIKREHGDGFAVILGTLKNGAILGSYICQTLEFISQHKRQARRVTTFKPVNIDIYKFIGVVFFAKINAFRRCLTNFAYL